MAVRAPILNVMIGAAEKAGRALVRDFGEVEHLQVSKKAPGDFVSTADLKSEKIIRQELEKAKPKYSFLFEESGLTKGEDTEHTWIVDPLDGTNNFLHGLPHWCVAIALEKNKEVIAAVVHDPIQNETFYAEKGTGAFSTGRRGRLRVSGRRDLGESLIAVYGAVPGTLVTQYQGCRIRHMGSSCLDLAYVASGRLEGHIERHLKPWDKAAGVLLIKEAGGYVTAMDGTPVDLYEGGIVGSNPHVHQELLKVVNANT